MGFVLDMPENDYHSHGALSKSQLDDFVKSPLNYWSLHLNPDAPPRKTTKAFELGTMAHKLILEGEGAFWKDYAKPMPEGLKKPTSAQLKAKKPSDKTKKQIEAWDEYIKENDNKKPLDSEFYTTCLRIMDAVDKHGLAKEILSDLKNAEVSAFYELNGVHMRSRIDATLRAGGMLDLKTTEDASMVGFKRSVFKWRYNAQDYLYRKSYQYCTGQKPNGFYFLAVEKKPPYAVGIYQIDQSWRDETEKHIANSLKYFLSCKEKDFWPGYNNEQIVNLMKEAA